MTEASSDVPSRAGARSSRLQVHPIRDEDLHDVARFLGEYYPPDTSKDEWAEAWRTTVNLPGSQAPNHGMLLRSGDQIVGAYPTIYSVRDIDGRPERFCNLAVWCVAPEYRVGAIRMLKAILAQDGFHFTDLTPIESVQRLNSHLGFQYLDTDTALIPNLPWPTIPRRIRISSRPEFIKAALQGQTLKLYEDHARCRWARHLVMVKDSEACYIQWRIEWRKRLPFASIRYASNPLMLRRQFRAVARHLLLRHRVPFSLVEIRVAGGRIGPSLLLPKLYRRMFKSPLRAEQIDYLYSEITAAP